MMGCAFVGTSQMKTKELKNLARKQASTHGLLGIACIKGFYLIFNFFVWLYSPKLASRLLQPCIIIITITDYKKIHSHCLVFIEADKL